MTEDHLLGAVLDMARLFGLKTAHFRAARRIDKNGQQRWETPVQGDGKGYPDLTIVGPGGVMFRELKSAKGQCSPEQVVWLRELKAAGPAGQDAAIWRPADLASGRIETELRALRGHVASANRKPAWMK